LRRTTTPSIFHELGKPFPPGIATFEEIRLEIERTLAKMQEVQGEERRFLLRRLHRLIILADKAIFSDKRSHLAGNLTTWRHSTTLRHLVQLALNAVELSRRT
jgi:hypothetical protein